MDSFQKIEQNLRRFVRQFYISALLKGLLMFLFVGLLFALLLLIVEHFLWLNSPLRTLLFWFLVSFESVIFYGFILSPLFKLFRIQNGIDFEFASKIIGDHFPEIKDKLLNVLQLKKHSAQTELLLASIEQKSNNLKTISFRKAVDLSANTKYIKYAFIPLLILFVFYGLGKQYIFTDSLKRVVNYKANYSPPAPFEFIVANPSLSTLENTSFTLKVKTKGSIVPEAVNVVYDDDVYLLNSVNPGVFEYQFLQPKETVHFKLTSGSVISPPLQLTVVPTPLVLGLTLFVYPPKYTQEPQRKIANNGNATVPEGSKLKWEVLTKSTDTVVFLNDASFSFFDKQNQQFTHAQEVFSSLGYSISTSNSKLKNFENLDYFINVTKDKSPLIQLQMKRDSTLQENLYFYGQVSDDYGVRALKLHYFPTDSPNNRTVVQLPLTENSPIEFTHVFPNNRTLLDDTAYSLYFEVLDNDPLHNYKSTRSRTFTYKHKSKLQLEALRLTEQSEVSSALQKALKALTLQDQKLKEISINQKETPRLKYSDQLKLKQFIERQKSQDKLLEKLNQTMEKNINQFKKDGKDAFKEQLQKRLSAQQEQLKKNEKILEEIEKVANKINKEELAKKLDEMAKQNKNKQRSLEQLLELTKRYYVTKKSEQINSKLKALSESQEQLADKSSNENNKSSQEVLNKSFDQIRKELAELKKDNSALAKPLQLPDDALLEESIAKDQDEALRSLKKKTGTLGSEKPKSPPSEAQKSQKKAAQKMRLMAQKMSQKMGAGGTKQMSEDVEVLRQILDNLILFSFEQEALMNQFVSAASNPRQYANKLLKQSNLRSHFEHVEDSLFALSLRQPMISESINKEVTEVFFNIDKSLALLSENELQKGISSQQFAMMATNKLADLLSNTLSNMEAQLELSPGQGQGEMQLPDIIMSQESLNEQIEQKLCEKGKDSEGESGKPKTGSKGKDKGSNGSKGATPSPGSDGASEEHGAANEGDSAELFEIFKRQQQLRSALQDLLQKRGMSAKESDLLKAMNKIEENLVNQGVTEQVLNQMKVLKHRLLKLNKAMVQQGEDSKRESNTSKTPRSQTPVASPETIKQYFNTTEILNRQRLPLRQDIKKKVQEYFKTTND
mgnify:FL=1